MFGISAPWTKGAKYKEQRMGMISSGWLAAMERQAAGGETVEVALQRAMTAAKQEDTVALLDALQRLSSTAKLAAAKKEEQDKFDSLLETGRRYRSEAELAPHLGDLVLRVLGSAAQQKVLTETTNWLKRLKKDETGPEAKKAKVSQTSPEPAVNPLASYMPGLYQPALFIPGMMPHMWQQWPAHQGYPVSQPSPRGRGYAGGRQSRRQGPAGQRRGRCRSCGEFGHWAADPECPSRRDRS